MNDNNKTSIWQGRSDLEDGIDGQRFHHVIQTYSENISQSGITFVGFASDLGVENNQGRVGAYQGPAAIRAALSNLAWHCQSAIYDAGDIAIEQTNAPDPLAVAQIQYAKQISQALDQQQFVIGLGGGHEIALGSYLGLRRHLDHTSNNKTRIGILNFDAHFDLRKPSSKASWSGSSGTPFYQIAQYCETQQQPFNYTCLGVSKPSNTKALFKFADEKGVTYLLDEQCKTARAQPLIDQLIASIDVLYVTICLDSLPAYVAPGVSAPSSLGIPLAFIIDTLRHVQTTCQEHKVVWRVADIAELNPTYDLDQRTAKVAARLVYEIIQLQTP